jgi:hypothetical protein
MARVATMAVAMLLQLAVAQAANMDTHHRVHGDMAVRSRGLFDLTIERTPLTQLDREENEKFHRQHAGHEAMHAEMMLVLLFTLFLSQVGSLLHCCNHVPLWGVFCCCF